MKSSEVLDAAPEHRGNLNPSFELGVLDQIITFRLRLIRNRLADRFRSGEWRDGLKHGEFTVLALTAANPGMSQNDLSRCSGFDKTTIVAILDDLERRGWAQRTRDPSDRRRHQVEVTADGLSMLDELLDHALENERAATGALSASELKHFMVGLEKIYRALSAQEG
jgi:DNA-binding MarR family transcriptional regulator